MLILHSLGVPVALGYVDEWVVGSFTLMTEAVVDPTFCGLGFLDI